MTANRILRRSVKPQTELCSRKSVLKYPCGNKLLYGTSSRKNENQVFSVGTKRAFELQVLKFKEGVLIDLGSSAGKPG